MTDVWRMIFLEFIRRKDADWDVDGGRRLPGLNAVIRAAVRKGILHYGDEFVGFMEGWRGVLDDVTMPLTLETTSGFCIGAERFCGLRGRM